MELPAFTSNSALLLENYVNVPHTLLGRKLQPFCLLHLFWLGHVGSPFVSSINTVTLYDIEIAVCICSSKTSEEILAKLSAGKKNAGLFARLVYRLWHWRHRKTNLQEAVNQWVAYQNDYCSLPEYAGSGGGQERLPGILLRVASVIKETGWAQDTVFTMPLGQVVWLDAALCYLRVGETPVLSDTDRAAFGALNRLTQGQG